MGKKAMLILIVALFAISLVYAETGTIQWRYKIRKFVEENIILSFTDNTGNAISNYAINLEKDLGYSQVHLLVTTNKVNTYTLMLTFSKLTRDGNQSDSFRGLYKARVSDIVTYSSSDLDYRDVVFSSEDSVSIAFPGDNSNSASNTVSFYYPISFDFSEYIDDYPSGTFVGTITVEVATE